MPKLTVPGIKKYAPYDKKRREIPDTQSPGLRLVIQPKPSGAMSWAVRCRKLGGKPCKVTLGRVDLSEKETEDEPILGAMLTLRQARELAAKIDRDRARGVDVAANAVAEKRRRRQAAVESSDGTFEALARRFIIRHAKPNTRRWKETARTLGLDPTKDELPVIDHSTASRWRGRLGALITKADVVAEIDRASDRAKTAGNKTRAALSQMFRWHAKRGALDGVPTAMVDAPVPLKKLRRSRRLSGDEFRCLWRALDECVAADEVPATYAAMVRFIMFTAVRRNEARELTEREVSADGKAWVVPGARTKNHLDHLVPLSPQAREMLRKVPRTEGKAGLVFSLNGKTPLGNLSRYKRKVNKRMLAQLKALAIERRDRTVLAHWVGIERLLALCADKKASKKERVTAREELKRKWWQLHDFRRNVRSHLSQVVSADIAERVLGHVKEGLRQTYDLHEYEVEKRGALEAWAREVDRILVEISQ
jgi:integrase